MTVIDSPNIIISYLPVSLDDAISYAKGVGRHDQTLQKKYIFRVPNDNIVKFEHQFMFATSKTDNIGSEILLECIDPDSDDFGSIDFRFFANTLETKYGSDALDDLRKSRLKELKSQNDVIGFLKKYIDSTETIKSRVYEADVIDADKKASDQFLTQFNALVQSILNSDSSLQEDLLNYIKPKIKKTEQVLPGGVRGEGGAFVTYTLDLSSLGELVSDLELDKVDFENILPTPYYYFYYGVGDDRSKWAGPIIAQFIKAKYNFSADTGKKTMELIFTSTYDFPAFSYLSLDKRGILVESKTDIIPIASPDDSNYWKLYIHEAIRHLITQYIKNATSDKCNILVLLPNLNDIFDKIIPAYLAAYLAAYDPNNTNTQAAMSEAYFKCFSDMGFDVSLLRYDDLNMNLSGDALANIRLLIVNKTPLNVKLKKSITLTPTGTGTVAQEYWENQGANKSKRIIALQIRKNKFESFMAPLKRILNGIAGKLSPVTPCLEVIENTEWARDMAAQMRGAFNFEESRPTVIFGDANIIEKYVYGKKIYQILNVLQTKTQTTTLAPNTLESLKSKLQGYLSDPKKIGSDSILTVVDRKFFSDDYIINIGAKHFLRLYDKPATSFYATKLDEFDLVNLDFANIEKANIPHFKLGSKESNILEVNLNLNDFYFAVVSKVYLLYSKLNSVIRGSLTASGAFVTDSYDPKFKKLAEDSYRNLNMSPGTGLNKGDLINQFYKQLNQDLKDKNLSNSQKFDLLFYMLAIKAEETRKNNPNILTTDPMLQINPYLAFMTLYGHLVNQAFIGTVKTIPCFSMSGSPRSLPPILLSIFEPTPYPYKKKAAVTSAFTGYWRVIGYKHTISTDDIFSEFYIVKDIKLDLPEILIPQGK